MTWKITSLSSSGIFFPACSSALWMLNYHNPSFPGLLWWNLTKTLLNVRRVADKKKLNCSCLLCWCGDAVELTLIWQCWLAKELENLPRTQLLITQFTVKWRNHQQPSGLKLGPTYHILHIHSSVFSRKNWIPPPGHWQVDHAESISSRLSQSPESVGAAASCIPIHPSIYLLLYRCSEKEKEKFSDHEEQPAADMIWTGVSGWQLAFDLIPAAFTDQPAMASQRHSPLK